MCNNNLFNSEHGYYNTKTVFARSLVWINIILTLGPSILYTRALFQFIILWSGIQNIILSIDIAVYRFM